MQRKISFACIVLAVVLALAGCGSDDDQAATSAAASGPTETALGGEAVEVLERDYKVFSGPRSDRDEVPEGLVPPSIAERLGLDLDNSRYARSYKGARLYVIPSRRVTCLFGEIAAISSCWPTWAVARGFGATTVLCGEGLDKSKVLTLGVAPHDVHKVTILGPHTHRLTVPVQSNVFVGETSSVRPPPIHLTWARFGQRVQHTVRKVTRHGC